MPLKLALKHGETVAFLAIEIYPLSAMTSKMGSPSSSVIVPRMVIGTFISTAIFFPSLYLPILTPYYNWLFNSRIFNCSLFETVEILLLYAIIEPIYTQTHKHTNTQTHKQTTSNKQTSKPTNKQTTKIKQ